MSFAYAAEAAVLSGVDLKLHRGEVCALLGPNGVGKTTLLRILLGLLRPTSGEIVLEGRRLAGMPIRERALRIAYVPQEAMPRFPMTVFEAVLLGRKPHMRWGPGKNDVARTACVLERMGLEALAQKPVANLSGGQRQKVALARAFVQETDWIVLDEPVSNLDLRHQLEVLQLVRDAAENNMGVLLSLHDINLAARYAHKVALLRRSEQGGCIVAHGKPYEVLTAERISHTYGVVMQTYHSTCSKSPLWFPSSLQA
ncbi:ABC transporter ATP-binding protein [Desulfovibrio sp.]|uniref:ABC transporter ATP-binding protein n=1 Tax=Desulfovibrio sp. TaxID=885 RepID=UPI0025C38DDE|nr:ABC transporter ATP-binding protein [Desulfovibrio sp.]